MVSHVTTKKTNMFRKLVSRSLAVVCCATILAAIGMMGVMNTAHAEYVGPSKVKQYKNVAEILREPVDDTYATLRGKIVNRLSDDMYQFSDGTGIIKVEIDEEDFAGQRVDANTQIEIWGKIDKDLMRAPEVDVKRLTVIR